MVQFDSHAESRVQFFPTVRVAYTRAIGAYPVSSQEAWKRLLGWLDRREPRYAPNRGFGLAHDNPQTTAAHGLRYDACVIEPPVWHDKDCEVMSRGVVPGGLYAVRRHAGPFLEVGAIISDVRDVWMPKTGLVFDGTRPVVAIFHQDPRITPPEQQTSQVCLPVLSAGSGRTPAPGSV